MCIAGVGLLTLYVFLLFISSCIPYYTRLMGLCRNKKLAKFLGQLTLFAGEAIYIQLW